MNNRTLFFTLVFSITSMANAGIGDSIRAFLYTVWNTNVSEQQKINRAEVWARFMQAQGKNLPQAENDEEVIGGFPQDLELLIDYIKNGANSVAAKFGATVVKGVLLYGPPGTGKTYIARNFAKAIGAGFFHANAQEFVSMWQGQTAEHVKQHFDKARAYCAANPGKYAVIFLDEIDAIGIKRDTMFEGEDVKRALTALLTQMDGFKQNDNIIVIAATNRREALDNALKRAGRFDKHVEVKLPNQEQRQALLLYYMKKLPNDAIAWPTMNVEALAQLTAGMNAADIKLTVNQAATKAAVDKLETVTQDCFVAVIKTLQAQKK